MTDVAQIAIEFCRECLGWEECRIYFGDTIQRTTGEQLRFSDLNAVMAAVRGWRDETQDAFDEYVTVTLTCAAGEYIGHAFVGTGQPTTAKSENPCHALLAACVEASRKLKAA